MSEAHDTDNTPVGGVVPDEGTVTLTNKRFVTINGTVSVEELRNGDVIRNLIGNGEPVAVLSIDPPEGFDMSESKRRILTVIGENRETSRVWLWKFSRVERVENA